MIHRNRDQLKLSFFTVTGNGGSNKDTSNTGVRITDLVTGIQVEYGRERSQRQNRIEAMQRLIQRLADHYRREEAAQVIVEANAGGLAIRTYQDRGGVVKDRRLPGQTFDYDDVLNGDLDPIIGQLLRKDLNHE